MTRPAGRFVRAAVAKLTQAREEEALRDAAAIEGTDLPIPAAANIHMHGEAVQIDDTAHVQSAFFDRPNTPGGDDVLDVCDSEANHALVLTGLPKPVVNESVRVAMVDAYYTITNSVTVESVERNGKATVDELETRVTFLYEALGGDASGVRTGCVPGSNWQKPPKPVIAGEWFRVRGLPAYVTSLPDGGPRAALLPPGTLRQRRVVGVLRSTRTCANA